MTAGTAFQPAAFQPQAVQALAGDTVRPFVPQPADRFNYLQAWRVGGPLAWVHANRLRRKRRV